ncbi:hypothetical protein N9H19_03725, partial [Flavobacteriales bacterium]|nr:hypothetical protein [Flavobacteriales bacterium]
MTELYINDKRIDLVDSVIAQTLQINELSNLDSRQSTYTNQFKVPLTPENIKTFELLGLVGNTSRVPYQRLKAKLVVDGIELISNGFAVINVTSATYYTIHIYDGVLSLFEKLKGLKMSDLDFTALNHISGTSTYLNSFDNTEGYIYALANFVSLNESSGINYARQTPSLFIHTLWQMIFEQSNIDYSGDIFDEPDFKELLMTVSKGYGDLVERNRINTDGTKGENNFVAPSNDDDILLSLSDTNTNTAFTIVTSGSGDFVQINIERKIYLTFNMDSVVRRGDVDVKLLINDTVVHEFNLSTPQEFESTSENNFFETEFVSGIGTTVRILVNENYTSGDWIEYDLDYSLDFVTKYEENIDEINFEDIIGDKLQTDFIKDIMQRFGIIFKPIKTIDADLGFEFITIEKLLGRTEVPSGDDDFVQDWSDKFPDILQTSYKVGDYSKLNHLKYNYDSDVIVPTHDGVITIDNENISPEKTLFTSIFNISKTNFEKYGNEIYEVPLWELKDG